VADIEKQMEKIIKSGVAATGKPHAVHNLSGDVNSDKNGADCINTPVDSADKPKTPMQRRIEAGTKNLVSLADRTTEEKQKIAIQGGKASGEARKKKKELKDRCKILLEMMPKQDLIAKSLGENVELPENADMYDLMMAKMIQVAALDGNVKAAEFVRDSAGDKPTDKSVVTASVITEKDKELMEIISRRMSAGDGQKPE